MLNSTIYLLYEQAKGLWRCIYPKSFRIKIFFCRGLDIWVTPVVLPKHLLSIEDRAFNGCKNLVELKIPVTVTEIEQDAFLGCVSLSKETRHQIAYANLGCRIRDTEYV